MKITKSQLKQIIKEELEKVMGERFTPPPEKDITPGMGVSGFTREKCKDVQQYLIDLHAMASDPNYIATQPKWFKKRYGTKYAVLSQSPYQKELINKLRADFSQCLEKK